MHVEEQIALTWVSNNRSRWRRLRWRLQARVYWCSSCSLNMSLNRKLDR